MEKYGALVIRRGSDSVDVLSVCLVQFSLDGADYCFIGMDGTSSEELRAMAEQLIRAAPAA